VRVELSAGECYTNTKVVAALTKAAADGGELEEAVRDCTRLSSAQIHEAYVATVNGTRMLVALDNWAAESLIDITVDVSGMDVLTDDEMLILGVDGSGTKTGPLIKVPVENRKGAKLKFALCRRLDVFSRLGVKLVVAKLDQQRWEVDIKQGDNEFSLRVTDENGEAAREVIATASVAELTQRMPVLMSKKVMTMTVNEVHPAWLKEFSPNPEKYRSEFSVGDKCYTYIDDWDAFQAVKASKNAQKHMKFVFKW